MAKSIIIIGAGIGGLTAASRLAHLGYDVTILEKNSRVGGKVSEFRAGGARWDIAPTPYAPKQALEALFKDLGLDLADYLRLQPIDPQMRYFFPDGATFDAHRDWAAMAAEINRLAPEDFVGYLRFLAYAARLQRNISPHSRDHANWAWLRSDPLRSMQRGIARHITSDKLQLVLGNFASLAGGSPYALPAAFNALAHQALTGGSWYPQNGMYSLASALERLAREQGASIQLNCPVKQIQVNGAAANGVELSDGQMLPADAVVSNVDVISTLRYLLPEGALPAPALRRLIRTPLSCSAYAIMLGVRGRFPQLAHHNIFFSADRRREYQEIFRREIMPADPTISITITSKSDPLNAPVNQENWLIIVNAPPLSEKFDWAAQRENTRNRILEILFQRFGLDLRDRIRIEQQLTPADFQGMTGAWRGALFGSSPHRRLAPFKGENIRSSMFARLYFASGATRLAATIHWAYSPAELPQRQ